MHAIVVCLLFDHTDPAGSSPYFHPVKWLILLFGSLFAGAGAVLVDNAMKRLRQSRCHNTAQLFHEVLAEHLIAYPPFFVALIIGADYKSDVLWGSPKDIIGVLVFAAFILYVVAVYLTTLHEEQFKAHHECSGKPPCPKMLSWWNLISMFYPTALMALALFVGGVYFSVLTY